VVTGVWLAAIVLGQAIAHPSVNYVATTPGMVGVGIAFLAESVRRPMRTIALQDFIIFVCCGGVILYLWVQ
jgi:aquaporin Z